MYRKLLLILLFSCIVSATFNECLNFRSLVYRSYDGACNNLFTPESGVANAFYSRGPEGVEYADGISQQVTNRPSERDVSNKIARDDPNENDSIPHALFATLFGQFVNHDLENNRLQDPGNFSIFPNHIPVPDKDDEVCFLFVNPATNQTLYNACLPPFNQTPTINSKFSAGAIQDGVFQVYNNATAWLDLSQVYGVNDGWNSLIRTHSGGLLSTSNYSLTNVLGSTFRLTGFQPYNFTLIDGPPSYASTGAPLDIVLFLPPTPAGFQNKLFTSGDERAGENPGLSMFHTLFIREHNRNARILAAAHPMWDDDRLFEEARRLNIAYYQNIVLYEYLQAEFGDYFFHHFVGNYRGYDCNVNLQTPVSFASSAFRYGHSSIRNWVPRDSCGGATLLGQPAGNQKLLNAGVVGGRVYPADTVAETGGYDNVIRGLIMTPTEPIDVECNGIIRSVPFRVPVAGGTDIFALDLARARMNGVPNYNAIRKAYYPKNSGHKNIYGAPSCPANLENSAADDPIGCFNVLCGSNSTLATTLKTIYKKVNRIDSLVGLLIEGHQPGTSFGLTLGRMITEHYGNIRDADRFWFENLLQVHAFSVSEIQEIKQTGMKDLLERNFGVVDVPANPFLVGSFSC